MKARIVKNLLQIGHTARDFIRLVRRNENSSMAHTQSTGHAATQMLESFEEIKLQPHVQTVIPVKGLVSTLTESLQDIPDLLTEDNGKMSGARLYVGCPVRVVGIPERKFFIREIFWDYGEARIREIGTEIEYVFPWDCLEFPQE